MSLTVRDLDGTREFYERVIGLRTLDRDGPVTALAGEEGRTLVELVRDPAAPPRPPGTTGLFHLAILVPDRAELARSLRRVAEAGGRLAGASDHLVSEALYLTDPEGNGIEIYRDRPRDEWRHDGGELRMATLPLDLRGLIDELRADVAPLGDASDLSPSALPAGTRIGHVHLQVADLRAAESFYAELLGFEPTARGYPGALFLSAGGYHHHIGLNTWAGEGAASPPAGATGLRSFVVELPDSGAVERTAERLEAGDADPRRVDGSLELRDPSGNGIVLRARS
ncbi:MAG TPA: VOC family protein [Thermoleophilaceae bacterium]|nr:VOC family protein [Thermoleophilaceae bacterium]